MSPESSQYQILALLRRLRTRLVAIEGSRAALWSLTWFLGLGSLAVLIEALVYLPPYWRLLPPGLAVTGAIVAARTVLRQGLGGVSDAHSMALFVERRVPVLGERLITAFELADDANCSTTLLAATREEALAALQQTDVSQISSLRRSRAALGAVAAGLALMLLIGTAFAEQIADVEHRWLHPTHPFSPPQRTQIALHIEDETVVAGDDVNISLLLDGELPTTATLARRYVGESSWLREQLLVETAMDARARYVWKDVRQSFEVQARAGDAETVVTRVEVLDPPVVTSIRLEFDYPAYSALPPRIEENAGDFRALPGTRVHLTASSNKRLRAAQIVIDDTMRVAAQISERTAQVEWILPSAGTTGNRHQYHFHLVGHEGITNRDPIRHTVDILQDEFPVVAISIPGHDTDLPESRQVLLGLEGRDDFGITHVDLVYQINEDALTRERIDMSTQRELSLHYAWDLSRHQLLPEDRVRYHVEVFDNDVVSGPKKGVSNSYTLRFPSLYELFDEVAIDQDQRLEKLEELAAEEAQARDVVEQLRREVLKSDDMSWQEKKELDAALEAEAERAEAVQELAREMAETMDQLEDSGLGSEQLLNKIEQIRELMAAVASPEMQEALEALQQATQGEMDPQRLAEALREFSQDQKNFQERLDRTISLLQQIHAEQRLMAATQQAEDLLQRQQQIDAGIGDQDSDRDHQRLADQEARLAADTQRLQQELDDLGDEMGQIHPPTAQGLEAQAESMEEGKLSQRMQQLEQQLKAGQSQQARREGEGLEQDLGRLSEAMMKMQGEFAAGQREDLIGAVRQVTALVLDLSIRQEDLRQRIDSLDSPTAMLEAPRQFALRATAHKLILALAEVGRQTMSLHPGLPTTLGYALQHTESAAGHLGQKERHRALELQSEAVARLNEAVQMLRQSEADLASSQMPSGFAEAMDRMLGLSQQQAALNEATQQALQQQGRQQGQQGRGGQDELLSRLAQEQRRIYQALGELERNLRGQRSMQERVGTIQKEMGDVLQQLEQRRPSQNLPQRQQRILQRMLDASRSIHARGFEKKRRSQVATEHAGTGPTWLPEDLGQMPDHWRKAMGNAMSGEYPAGYRQLVRRYYEAVYSDLSQSETDQP
ncbi:MAG: hypothetical protein HOM68_11050 [Gemmatimonadetes bacterium]|nr:hypothetical protein [Gemmatimonadota bacterium]